MNDVLDVTGYLQFVIALAFVIGLILVAAMMGRRWMESRVVTGRKRTGRSLQIIETLPLDAKRRIVLIQRDDRRHLILLGMDGDTIIEKDIAVSEDEEDQDGLIAGLQSDLTQASGKVASFKSLLPRKSESNGQ